MRSLSIRFGPRVQAVLLAAGAGALLLHAHHAGASGRDVSWCWGDPLVRIGGVTVDTTFAVQAGVAGPGHQAVITYTVPAGVPTALLDQTGVFDETVRFRTDTTMRWAPGQPVPVTVTLDLPGDGRLPARMVNSANGAVLSTVTGTAATPLTTTFNLR